MSIEAIKGALEGVTPDRLRYEADAMYAAVHGEKYGDTFHAFNWADKPHRVLYDAINLIRDSASEIDRLQRENEALREDRYKLACAITGGEDAPGLLDSTPTSEIVEIAQHAHRMHQGDIDRAMAAEAEVKRLRSGIKWCLDRDKRNGSLPGSYAEKLQALASTGGEHHAE